MKTVLFRVIKREPILDFIRKNPTHFQMQAKKIIIILEYKPLKSLNETKYLEKIKTTI